jgi:hypothetical protein
VLKRASLLLVASVLHTAPALYALTVQSTCVLYSLYKMRTPHSVCVSVVVHAHIFGSASTSIMCLHSACKLGHAMKLTACVLRGA